MNLSEFLADNSTEMVIEDNVAYFTTIDYTVFISILSVSLAIGIYFGFFSDSLKTTEDYLVGGHKMKAIPIAISMVARCLFYSKIN